MKKKELMDKADHLARMVCKLLRDDIKGDRAIITHGEQRRLVNLAIEWLEAYHKSHENP